MLCQLIIILNFSFVAVHITPLTTVLMNKDHICLLLSLLHNFTHIQALLAHTPHNSLVGALVFTRSLTLN